MSRDRWVSVVDSRLSRVMSLPCVAAGSKSARSGSGATGRSVLWLDLWLSIGVKDEAVGRVDGSVALFNKARWDSVAVKAANGSIFLGGLGC